MSTWVDLMLTDGLPFENPCGLQKEVEGLVGACVWCLDSLGYDDVSPHPFQPCIPGSQPG